MRLMPLLQFLGALLSHVSCNKATFRKYILLCLDFCSDAKLERVFLVAYYMWSGTCLGRKVPKVVMRNDVSGRAFFRCEKQPNGNFDGDGRCCIGSFENSARILPSLSS